MDNFTYRYPVRQHFGKGCAESAIKEEMARVGRNVLLAYGGGSLKRSGLELLLDYCARFYERQFACRTDINRKYLAVLDEALDSYFGLHCQKSVEEGICRMESVLSELSPAYLNDLVHAETGKTLAEYIRFRMIGYIRMRVCNEGCPLEQVAGEFGFRQPVLSRLEKIVFLQRKPHEMFGTQFS